MSVRLTADESHALACAETSAEMRPVAAALRRCMAEVERLQGVVMVQVLENDKALHLVYIVQKGNSDYSAEVSRLQSELTAMTELCQTYMAERGEARAAQVVAERERDLAIAHDTQPYPTAHAYEQVCKALAKEGTNA